MRQGSNARRPRGRPHRRQGGTINKNANFDSNGPEGRVRGNAHQVYEKYINLARDATSAGDRILAESFYQFAEHYYRIANDSMDPASPRRHDGNEASSSDSDNRDGGDHGDHGDQGSDEDEQDQRGRGRGRRQRMNGRGRDDRGASQQEGRQGEDAPSGDDGSSGGGRQSDSLDAGVERTLALDPSQAEQPSIPDSSAAEGAEEQPKPRRRGRPRKNPDQQSDPVAS